MTIDFSVKYHGHLSLQELYGILQLRNQVFIVELECPVGDVDGEDVKGDTYHLMGKDNEQIVAYLRMHKTPDNRVQIRRVVVAKAYRKQGLARELMQKSIEWSKINESRAIELAARIHLRHFYEKLGFQTVSDVYFHDAVKVWHIDMMLTLASPIKQT